MQQSCEIYRFNSKVRYASDISFIFYYLNISLGKNIIIDYCGPIQYEKIGELILELKNKSQKLGIPIGVYKRILLVMIESLENIIKHNKYQVSLNKDCIYPNIKIEKCEKTYRITSFNILHNKHVPIISNKINYINTLDPQGLKDYYKNVITNGEFSQKGGAGLGLIEMAKSSGHKITYEFLPVDQAYSSFKLQIMIDH